MLFLHPQPPFYLHCHENCCLSPLQTHTHLSLPARPILLLTSSKMLSRYGLWGASGNFTVCLSCTLFSTYNALGSPEQGAGWLRFPLLPVSSSHQSAQPRLPPQMDFTFCSISFDTLSAGDGSETVFCQLLRHIPYLPKTSHSLARQLRTQ